MLEQKFLPHHEWDAFTVEGRACATRIFLSGGSLFGISHSFY